VTLVLDGCFLAAVGLITTVAVFRGEAGNGPFGSALRGQPFVVGFAEATLLITVIGLGALAAGLFAASWIWHAFLVAVHVTLMGVDLGFRAQMTRMGLDVQGTTVLSGFHAAFVVAHGFCLVQVTRRRDSS
jgi:hypothetical protein